MFKSCRHNQVHSVTSVLIRWGRRLCALSREPEGRVPAVRRSSLFVADPWRRLLWLSQACGHRPCPDLVQEIIDLKTKLDKVPRTFVADMDEGLDTCRS